MFSGPVAASTVKMKPVPSDKMNRVLGRILEKWQAETDKPGSQPVFEETSDHPDVDETVVFSSAAQEPSFSSDSGMLPPADVPALDSPDIPPPDTDDWDPDIQETVVFSASGIVPPVDDIDQDDAPVLPPQAPSWNDDIEETVVMRTGSDTPPPVAAPFDDDMDQTVVISPPSHPPGSPPTGNDDPLAATMLQHAPGPPDASFDRSDGDLESTVILNTGAPPAPSTCGTIDRWGPGRDHGSGCPRRSTGICSSSRCINSVGGAGKLKMKTIWKRRSSSTRPGGRRH